MLLDHLIEAIGYNILRCIGLPLALATPLIVWAISSSKSYPFLLSEKDYPDRDVRGGNYPIARDIRFRDLTTPYAIALGLQTILAGPALRISWSTADIPLVLSTILAIIWWVQLRRRGVKHAEVYALTAWIAPRLAWTATSMLFSGDFHWNVPGYDGLGFTFAKWSDIVGGETLPALALMLGAVPLLAALVAMRLRISRFQPLAVASLAFGYVAIFWVTNPFGALHSMLAMGLIGFGVSRVAWQQRETQRAQAAEATSNPANESDAIDGSERRAHVIAIADLGIATVLCAVGISRGLIWLFSDWPVTAHESMFFYSVYLVYVIAAGVVILIIAAILALRRRLMRYGAVILGLMWPMLMLFAFDLVGRGEALSEADWLVSWQPHHLITTIILTYAMIWIMWCVFGPGSIGKRRG